MQIITPSMVANAMLKQRAYENRIGTQTAGVYNQIGKSLITNVGISSETSLHVDFLNLFIEEPLFTFGSALETNQSPVSGSYPTVSATVARWDYISSAGPWLAYTGATIIAVTTGIASQSLYLHYNFMGRAIAFPTSSSPVNGTGNA